MVKDAYNNDSQSELDITHPDVQDLFFLLKCILDNYMCFEYDRNTTNNYRLRNWTLESTRSNNWLCRNLNMETIFFHGRFWDEGFVAFNGTESEAMEFFNIGNNC